MFRKGDRVRDLNGRKGTVYASAGPFGRVFLEWEDGTLEWFPERSLTPEDVIL